MARILFNLIVCLIFVFATVSAFLISFVTVTYMWSFAAWAIRTATH